MIELRVSHPNEETQQRLTRIRCDARELQRLSPAQARAVYEQIEVVRDMLSYILDHADGKSSRY